ncbi:MAG TPA: hypothetical protein VHK90_04365 [Thermoanaerobaculia bacterium]|nr:hypothetical protein [Thermoanaerobaculia bacterium]
MRLVLDIDGEAITGWLIPKSGPRHPITGEWYPEAATLRIGELPADSSPPCFQIAIIVDGVEYRGSQPVAFEGHLSGRCPNTLASRVRFVRE